MVMSISKRYFEIVKVNLRHNLFPHLMLALMITAVTPLIFGVGNLDQMAVWVPLEMFFSLIGIVLLTPVFVPEQAAGAEDVVSARFTNINGVYLIRICYSIIAIILIVFGFCTFLLANGSDVVPMHVLGTVAEAVFLGALGVLGAGLSNNIAVGYMFPILYYAINYSGGKYLGYFYLFSGAEGGGQEKLWLFIAGAVLIALTLVFRIVRQKKM